MTTKNKSEVAFIVSNFEIVEELRPLHKFTKPALAKGSKNGVISRLGKKLAYNDRPTEVVMSVLKGL